MLSTSGFLPRTGSQLTANSYNFAINTNNDVSLEIKRRVTLANRCHFGLNMRLSSRVLTRATKLTLYKALILPVLLYCAQAWALSSTDAAALGVFERTVLRKIFGPVRAGDDYRIRTNRKLYEHLMTWTLLSVLITSGSAGSAMSFGWMKTLL